MSVNNIGKVEVVLSARDSDMSEGFKKLGHHMSEAQKQFKEFKEQFEQVNELAEAVGIVYLGEKISELAEVTAEWVKEGIEAIAMMQDQAETFGITTEAAGAMSYAAASAGIASEKLTKSMAHLQGSVLGLRNATPEMVKAFGQLGLTADDLKGKKLDEVLGIVADRIRAMPDAAEKASVALKLFGDAGRDGGAGILEFLSRGKKGFEEARESAEALGVAVSEVDASSVKEADIALKEAGQAVQGIKNNIAIELAPSVREMSNDFVKLAKETRGFRDAIHESVQSAGEIYGEINSLHDFWDHGAEDLNRSIRNRHLETMNYLQGIAHKSLEIAEKDRDEDLRSVTEYLQKEVAAERAAAAEIEKISAEHFAVMRKNRESLTSKAVQDNPDVQHQEAVLKYMKQGMDKAQAEKKARQDEDARAKVDDRFTSDDDAKKIAIANREKELSDDITATEVANARKRGDANQQAIDRYTQYTQEAERGQAEKKKQDAKDAADQKKEIDDGLDEFFKSAKEQSAADKERNREKVQNYSEAMSNIDQVNQFFGKKGQEAFWANKAFEVAQATINAWMAYSNTLGSVSFSASPADKQVLAASQLALGMVAVANISSQQPAGSRATGGPVSSGSMYEVNERGPELLTVGGRDYLMMGDQGGHVTANQGGPGGGGVAPVTVHIHNNSPAVSPRVETGPDGSIQVILDMVDEHQAAGVASGKSKTARAMSQVYNLNRSPGAR